MHLEEAIVLAVRKHKGQVDKQGKPYILHVLRVMLAVREPREMLAGVLHDIVEDTDVTLDDLLNWGVPEEVVSAIDCLTRREGEAYHDFVKRAAANPIARVVKIADIRDNLDPERLAALPYKTRRHFSLKYTVALEYLEEF